MGIVSPCHQIGLPKLGGFLTNGADPVNSGSLCAPEANLSCFGCCPPIRPAGYDHLDHVGSLRREFCENRLRFLQGGPRWRPIVGFSCWALGYLDARGRTVGCLLHPFQNHGEDLRHLIDYGNKCHREQCEPSRVFGLLPPSAQRFWLPLVRGMNPFFYSSPRANPLFHLMLWGERFLEHVRLRAESKGWDATELICRSSFLTDRTWKPKAQRYLFRLALENGGPAGYGEVSLAERCRGLLDALATLRNRQEPEDAAGRANLPFVHSLDLDPDFLRLLRLELGWTRCAPEAAERIHRKLLALVEEDRSTSTSGRIQLP